MKKKHKDKKLIQKWRPISLLNCDTKIISKALGKHLKNVHLLLNSGNKSSYVDGRLISEYTRLISDVLQTSANIRDTTVLLLTLKKLATRLIIKSCFKKIWIWQKIYKMDTNTIK